MSHALERVHAVLPGPLRAGLSAAVTWGGRRRLTRGVYASVRSHIQTTERLSAADWTAYQLRRLREIVEFTWQHSSGYRDHWQAAGFAPDQLRSLDDVQRIPFVTKEMFRDQLERLSTEWRPRKRKLFTTSGSTGVPFGFYADRYLEDVELAFIHDLWSRRGYETSWRTAMLRGTAVERGDFGSNVAEYSLYGGIVLDPYRIGPNTIGEYAQVLGRYRPDMIRAYPSALEELTSHFLRAGITPPHTNLRCIMLGSELLLPRQEHLIREAWSVPIMHWYGMSEKVILAGWCEHQDVLHVYPQYGLTEFIREDGASAAVGERAELVGTSFYSRQTPFIRYRTGDFAVQGPSGCPQCGRQWQMIVKMEGRAGEMIVGTDGRRASATSVISAVHEPLFSGVDVFQFVQQEAGEATMNYVAATVLPDPQCVEIERHFRSRLGDDFVVRFKRVPAISRTGAGKHLFFYSELSHPPQPQNRDQDGGRP